MREPSSGRKGSAKRAPVAANGENLGWSALQFDAGFAGNNFYGNVSPNATGTAALEHCAGSGHDRYPPNSRGA